MTTIWAPADGSVRLPVFGRNSALLGSQCSRQHELCDHIREQITNSGPLPLCESPTDLTNDLTFVHVPHPDPHYLHCTDPTVAASQSIAAAAPPQSSRTDTSPRTRSCSAYGSTLAGLSPLGSRLATAAATCRSRSSAHSTSLAVRK